VLSVEPMLRCYDVAVKDILTYCRNAKTVNEKDSLPVLLVFVECTWVNAENQKALVSPILEFQFTI